MWRVLRAGVVLAFVLIAVGPAANAAESAADILVSGGPLTATRAADGSTTLSLTISNLTDAEMTVSLQTLGGSCSTAVAEPSVAAATSAAVTVTMQCSEGSEPRAGVVRGSVDGGAVRPAEVPLSFTVEPATASSWWKLSAFGLAAYLSLFLAVLLPFLLWSEHPLGNPGSPPSGVRDAGGAGDGEEERARAAADAAADEQRVRADVRAAGGQILLWPLPGITKDWSFTDNWVSNIGLGGALVTALFASTDTLTQVLGLGSSGGGAVVAVAGAISAALISSGPMWLTIWKRRYVTQHGIARHNTIAGVLSASSAVLTGALGLVLVGAWVLDIPAAWIGAGIVVLFLLLYAWKSIPQTLALGMRPPEPASDETAAIGGPTQPRKLLPSRAAEQVAAMP